MVKHLKEVIVRFAKNGTSENCVKSFKANAVDSHIVEMLISIGAYIKTHPTLLRENGHR
jgi:hypothetical protein